MPKKQRLSRADIKTIDAKRSRRIPGDYFVLACSTLSDLAAPSKAACVVSKKVSGRAVDRNRIKRRCREAIRAHLARQRGRSFIFHAKRESRAASFAEIERDLKTLLSRASEYARRGLQ